MRIIHEQSGITYTDVSRIIATDGYFCQTLKICRIRTVGIVCAQGAVRR